MKRCATCGDVKPLDAFYRRRSEPDGRARCCLDCGASKRTRASTQRAERAARDPEFASRQRRYARDYRRRIRDEIYGVPAGTIESLEAAQAGRCAICERTADEVACAGRSGERLHVDHCHRSGHVRGLLCKKCNSVLGLVDDDVDRLIAAAFYLAAAARPEVALNGS